MNWKVCIAVGAAVGSVFWAVRQRSLRDLDDSTLWAEATDRVTPLRDS